MTETPESREPGREPVGLIETVAANCRPWPALPAVMAFALMVMLPTLSGVPQPGDLPAWQLWLIFAGLLMSCALAVAAGFCSLAPQAAWILLAFWFLSVGAALDVPRWLTATAYLGIAVAGAMIIVQLWRIRTRRFVPTVFENEAESEDG